jgi:hypothetical protein
MHRGCEGTAVNFRRGLFRTWLFLSALWLATWAFYIWDSRLVATEDESHRPFVAYHTDFGQGWKEPKDFSASDYLSLVGIGLGIPVLILGLGVASAWAIAGFRSN